MDFTVRGVRVPMVALEVEGTDGRTMTVFVREGMSLSLDTGELKKARKPPKGVSEDEKPTAKKAKDKGEKPPTKKEAKDAAKEAEKASDEAKKAAAKAACKAKEAEKAEAELHANEEAARAAAAEKAAEAEKAATEAAKAARKAEKKASAAEKKAEAAGTEDAAEKAAAAKKEARAARRKAKSAEKKAEHVAEVTGESLDWKERMVENRVVHEAKFNGGSFKILRAGQRWALFYEWKDGTFRDLEVGSVDHLKWTAEVFVKHGMHRFGTAREFVDATKAEGPDRFAPPVQGRLTWIKDTPNDAITYLAALPRYGHYEAIKQADASKYVLTWHPLDNDEEQLGEYSRAIDAKRRAQRHADLMTAEPHVQRVSDTELTWLESTSGDRRICIASAGDGGGKFKLVESTTGAYGLFYIRSEDDWQELGCGTEDAMKERAEEAAKAQKSAKSRKKKKPPKRTGAKKAETPATDPEATREPETTSSEAVADDDAAKQKIVMGGLEEILEKAAEKIA